MNSADALVENTAIDDTDCSTELNDVVRNCYERYCAFKYIHVLLFVVVLRHRSK